MRPLRIFIVHPSEMLTDHLPNGAGWIVFNYLKGLAERGHTVHVCVPRVELIGPIPIGMHLHVVPQGRHKGALNRFRYMLEVRRLFSRLSAENPFDLAQQFTPVNTGLSLALLGAGVPLVLGPYSGHWSPEAFGEPERMTIASKLKLFMRDCLASLQQRQARALIITCPAASERILSPGLRETRVHVISHGIHTKGYAEREGLPERPSILFLANLEYWKGIFTLLDAFEVVAKEMPDCTLEVWGDGKEVQAVHERVLKSSFKDRIHLKGRASREAVSGIMRAHSVYCMPSYGEPFGMTILEAMASGVPIVTTNAGGPAFLVCEQGGRIVPMRDSTALASALLDILASRSLQRAMGEFNRKRVELEFDWSRSLDRMEAVYERILTGGIGPSARSKAPRLEYFRGQGLAGEYGESANLEIGRQRSPD
jgi:glycosyltransferase involved in cell wall biosynthesis